MKTSINDTESQHQEIALLLPWFVNNSLEGEELSHVEKHIRHCFICRRELVELRKLATLFSQKSDLDIAAETSFARLGVKLAQPKIVPLVAKVQRNRDSRRYSRNSYLRYGLAASLLIAALLPLAIPTLTNYGNDSYATLSSARPTVNQSGQLRVVFAKSASAADIASLLEQLHGQQIGEANSVGALNIRLSSDDNSLNMTDAIAMLRSRPDVLLAEPVLQP